MRKDEKLQRGQNTSGKYGDKAVRLRREKRLAEGHLDNKENELKVASCHVLLETMFGIKVVGLINSP